MTSLLTTVRAAGPRDQAFDGGEHIVNIEWLGEELDLMEIDVADDRTHQDDGDTHAILEQSTNQRYAVESRHHQIGDHQIRRCALRHIQGGKTIIGANRAVSLIFKEIGEEITDWPLIVDDEDRLLLLCHCA